MAGFWWPQEHVEGVEERSSPRVENPPTTILAWFLREDERSCESIHRPDDANVSVGSRAGRIHDQNTFLKLRQHDTYVDLYTAICDKFLYESSNPPSGNQQNNS
jgi:hypothetical protein